MIRIARSIAAACLVLAGTALASTATVSLASAATVPLASPPLASDPAASMIFDAMLAIGRASLIDPRRAEQGVVPYAAAMKAYAAGDLAGARQSAIAAIVAINSPYEPLPTTNSPVVSPTPPAQYPRLVAVAQSESEDRLAIARRALLDCGATTGATFLAARPLYDDAVHNMLANQPNALNADVQTIVDKCAAALPTAAAP